MRRLSVLLALGLACPAGLGARDPGIFRVCADVSDPPTLDPQKQFAEKNHVVCQQIFDGLIRFSAAGAIEPSLAVSWERIDPLRMRFFLRPGVRFHNGEPFDAESVKFSVERYLDPETGFPGLGFIATIRAAEVVDPLTVDIVTHQPDGLLLRRLEVILISPPKYFREAGQEAFARRPVGTGAFRFKSWTAGRSILLEANRDYWMKGYPKSDGLEFRYIPKKDQISELFAGAVDLLMDIPGTKTLTVQTHAGTEVRKGRSFYTAAAALRFDRGPLSDERVRRALNHAVDRNALVRYDLLGNGTPVASLSMPGEEGHEEGLSIYDFDLKKAASLLAEAGYAKGVSLRATVKDSVERTAKILAADWKKIGVNLSIDLMTEAQMPQRFQDPKYDIAIGDIPNPTGHVYFIPSLVIYSKSPFSLAKDPTFDAKLESMASTIDDGKRVELSRALDRYIYEKALSIFTYQRSRIYGVRKGAVFDHYVTGRPYFHAALPPQ